MEDLELIDKYRKSIKKLQVVGFESLLEKAVNNLNYLSTKTTYTPNVSMSRLIKDLGFREKLETYFNMVGDNGAWTRFYLANKKDKRKLRGMHGEIMRLAQISDFLHKPMNQSRYHFRLDTINSAEAAKQAYDETYNMCPAITNRSAKRKCYAIDDASTVIINVIQTKQPHSIVLYKTVYEEISDYIELLLQYVSFDLSIKGIGITVQGKTIGDILGLNVCVSLPTDPSGKTTFQTCLGGEVKKGSLDYNAFELRLAERASMGTKNGLVQGEIIGKGTLTFRDEVGKGLNVTVGFDINASAGIKSESFGQLDIVKFKAGTEIGINFKRNKDGTLETSPIINTSATGKDASGQKFMDIGVKIEKDGTIVYSGITDLTADPTKSDDWDELQYEKPDIVGKLRDTLTGEHVKNTEVNPPQYSYENNRFNIKSGIVGLRMVPNRNSTFDIIIGFNLSKSAGNVIENGIERVIKGFDGTWDELGEIITRYLDHDTMDIISNIFKTDYRWTRITKALFYDLNFSIGDSEEKNTQPLPQTTEQPFPQTTEQPFPQTTPRPEIKGKKHKTKVFKIKPPAYYIYRKRNGGVETFSSINPPLTDKGYSFMHTKTVLYDHCTEYIHEETSYIVIALKKNLGLDQPKKVDKRSK